MSEVDELVRCGFPDVLLRNLRSDNDHGYKKSCMQSKFKVWKEAFGSARLSGSGLRARCSETARLNDAMLGLSRHNSRPQMLSMSPRMG